MDNLIDERIGESRKIHGIQILLASSFASFAVFATMLVVFAIFAITETGIEPVWFIVMLVSIISSGVFLIPALVLTLVKESNKKIADLLIISVPIIAAIIQTIFLYGLWNEASIIFKDHFAMVGAYPHFKENMWRAVNHLLDISIWILLAIVALTIIKIIRKEWKKSIPIICTSIIGLLGILPVQITGIVISKTDATYELGIKMFWGALIGLAIIGLISYYFILSEIENNALKKLSESKQVQKNNAKIVMIIGAVSIIVSMIWLLATTSNEELVSYQYHTMPKTTFPALALYGFGTAIIAYNLLKWQKAIKKQKLLIYFAILSIAVIIPAKIFSIYYVWYWGAKNNLITIWGWDNETKPFTLVLTDLLPIAVFLFCTSFLVWQKKENKLKNSWLLIVPILTFTASMIFLSITIWYFWGTVTYNLDNFYNLFVISSIIAIIEMSFLIVINSLGLIKRKEVNLIEK
ncbi:MAG: hypothetical protein FK733_18130 [Asgard group archaeon]|nr:hypothetical protein [Asgard group archaeon]